MTPATQQRGPVPGVLGAAMAWGYGNVVAWRNRRFDRGRGVVAFDRPVVSVGNLSVGGTGKSPFVAWVLRRLIESGRSPCVAMRGYGAPRGGVSDEAADFAAAFPGVPIVARPNRVDALIELFASPAGEAVDAVVLDDGFQHRRIARDLDVVLVDATRPPWQDSLLPRGWLREPADSLRRAGATVLTRADLASDAARLEAVDRLRALSPKAVIATARHGWDGLDLHDVDGSRQEPQAWLAGRSVFVACALGNPQPFVQAVERAGAAVAGRMLLRDHDPFDTATVRWLVAAVRSSGASALVVTSKDWAKLSRVPADAWPVPRVVPRVRIEIMEGERELRAALDSAVRTTE